MKITRTGALVIILVCALLWGSSFILMKKALVTFTYLQVGILRILVAGIVILPFTAPALRRHWAQLPKDRLLLSSTMGTLIPAILFPLAQTHITSGTTGILNSLTPLFTLLLGILLFGQRWHSLRVLGVGLGLAGAGWLILLQGEMGGSPVYALVIVLATGLYGFNTNFVKYRLAAVSPLLITGFGLSVAVLPALAALLLGTDFQARLQHPQVLHSLAAVALLGALGTSLALWLYFHALKRASAVGTASVTYLMPAVALGWALLDGEAFKPSYLWSLLLILLGVWLVNRTGKPA
ncbi:MAG: DMT family transporter [Bacteroidetes bacterium]|nr:DMT family transporter [Bacteroidota bacterium]